MKFDELAIGDTFQTEPYTVTKEEIIEFAEKYDPQHMHLDEEKAKTGPFGGLIASGLHSLAGVWSKWVALDVVGEDAIGGAGIERLNWLLPVKPDDQLIGEFQISQKRKLSDGVRGLITINAKVHNQNGKEVMEFTLKAIIHV